MVDLDENDAIAELLLHAAGLTVPRADLPDLVVGIASMRQIAATLYAVPSVRYADPATTFDPRE